MWKKVIGYFRDEKNPIKVETRKAFAIIFVILSIVGVFTVASTFKGFQTVSLIRTVQIPQYQAAENLQQKATEIIGIYYLLSGENDLNMQMKEMYRYDQLEKDFLDALQQIRTTADKLVVPASRPAAIKLVEETQDTFNRMNTNARSMTFNNMEGKREEAKQAFALIGPDIELFKKGVAEIEGLLNEDLKVATESAQRLLQGSMIVGILVTIASVMIALVLINQLLKFLSVTLLPVSNLMHNLRQAVFSIDKSQKVVSPVSKYSQNVFASDIVNNNIFELAFNDLGQKSEAYAATKTAMTSVFDEDEMQWSLMEDNFPPLITKRFANGTEKILKMSYTPLFDEKTQNVQNIMIVAEDVTELEKAKREASNKQAEVLVIQGLVGVDRGDLEAFLNDAISGIGQCYDLLATFETDFESRKVLFRILHTIKGNSRLYNLMTISEVVHVAENSVVEISKRLDAKETVGTEFYANLTQGLRRIDEVLASHAKTAESLFGIKSSASAKREDLLVQNMMANEFAIADKLPVVFDKLQAESMSLKSQYVLSALSSSLREGLNDTTALVRYFGKEDLASSMDAFAKGFKEQDIENGTADFNAVKESYFRLLFQSPRKKKYDLNIDDLLEPMARMFAVTKISKNYLQSALPESDAKVICDQAFELYRSFDALTFAELRYYTQRMLLVSEAGKSTAALDHVMKQMWQYVLMMFHVDSSFKAQTEGIQVDSGDLLTVFEKGAAAAGFDGIDDNQFLVVDFIRAQESGDVTSEEFCELMLGYTGLASPSELAAFLAGSNEVATNLGKIFELIKDGLSTAANQKNFNELVAGLSQSFVRNYFETCLRVASKRMDFYRIAANYLPDETLVTEVSAQQSYEVSVNWYEQVSELVDDILGQADNKITPIAEDLKGLVESIFDYPIKTLCGKMEPMVKDLTKRLGKNINYVVAGDMVAMPREQGYQLRDALVHMLRNSLDHGIEMPADRVTRAKPDVATIEVRTRDLKGAIEVVVRDDGNGIDVEKVVKKAIAMNAITAEKAATMTDKEKQELIFLSRLSTKDEVSSLSGRGVGMDAVKAIIVEKLKGSISLETEFSKGSKFTLTIPKLRDKSSSQRGGSEIEGFLTASVKSMEEATELFGKLLVDAEARSQLFRILHTMKGSASMHNLKNIAELVHVTENIVSDMSTKLDKKETVSEMILADLMSGLDKIEKSLRSELNSRSKSRTGANVSELSRFLTQAVEQLASCSQMAPTLITTPESGKKMFQILHTLKGNAQLHNLSLIAAAIHKVEGELEAVNVKWDRKEAILPPEISKVCEGLVVVENQVSAQLKKGKNSSNRTKTPTTEADSYLTQAIGEISEAIALLKGLNESAEARQKIFQVLHTMKGNCQLHNFSALSSAIHIAEGSLEVLNSKLDKKESLETSAVDQLASRLNGIKAAMELRLTKTASAKPIKSSGGEGEQFLRKSAEDLQECYEWCLTLAGDVEVGQRIFQILHTMKGNAQMHNAKDLAQSIHKLESTLESINSKLDKKEPVGEADLGDFSEGIKSLIASSFTQSKPKNRTKKGPDLNQDDQLFLNSADESITECLVLCAGNVVKLEDYRQVFNTIHTLKGNAELYNLHQIVTSLHEAETNLTNIAEQLEKTNQADVVGLGKVRDDLEKVKNALRSAKKKPA